MLGWNVWTYKRMIDRKVLRHWAIFSEGRITTASVAYPTIPCDDYIMWRLYHVTTIPCDDYTMWRLYHVTTIPWGRFCIVEAESCSTNLHISGYTSAGCFIVGSLLDMKRSPVSAGMMNLAVTLSHGGLHLRAHYWPKWILNLWAFTGWTTIVTIKVYIL